MRATSLVLAAVAVAAVAMASAAQAAPILTTADNRQVNTGDTVNGPSNTANVHAPARAVYVFQLPDVGTSATAFADAQSQFSFYGWQFGDIWDYQQMNVAGMGVRDLPTVLGTDFSAAATTIQTGIMKAVNSEPAQWRSTTGTTLASFMDTQYASGANIGKYVFIRLDTGTAGNDWHGFTVDLQGSGNVASISIPEPASLGVLALAGVGLIARRRKA